MSFNSERRDEKEAQEAIEPWAQTESRGSLRYQAGPGDVRRDSLPHHLGKQRMADGSVAELDQERLTIAL
jgi:hypothetical protein